MGEVAVAAVSEAVTRGWSPVLLSIRLVGERELHHLPLEKGGLEIRVLDRHRTWGSFCCS